VLYHVPTTCTNAAGSSEELFPDLHDFSRSDFGLGECIFQPPTPIA
jgi:hypothetical protein